MGFEARTFPYKSFPGYWEKGMLTLDQFSCQRIQSGLDILSLWLERYQHKILFSYTSNMGEEGLWKIPLFFNKGFFRSAKHICEHLLFAKNWVRHREPRAGENMAPVLKEPCGEKDSLTINGRTTRPGLNGGMGAGAWGPQAHITWGNHESLHRGGRLLRRESLPDGQEKGDSRQMD